MRVLFFILCLSICVIAKAHANDTPAGLAIDYPPWSTTVRTFMRKGYKTNTAVPLIHLESKVNSEKSRSTRYKQKVAAVSRRQKSKGMLIHQTAVFFENQFVKLEHVIVFKAAQRPTIIEVIRGFEVKTIGAPGVLYEAINQAESARWVYQTPEAQVSISVLIDDEGGILKIEHSIQGTEATLEQYRRHLVARQIDSAQS